MRLSEELTYRGFTAEHTFDNITDLDARPRSFYLGVDPSADSMTIGNLAALMMASVFIRHGYHPTLLVGGATGQIGDPKLDKARAIKPLSEVAHNKAQIATQFQQIIKSDFRLVDNYDWFKDIGFLPFLREIGKEFSMTQLLDREFVKSRIGEGSTGLSYAEFTYALIQGYDFLHLYREYDIDLQICGADQFGNCASGLHLIKRLENARADIWSTPLVINQSTGQKFGKSESGAIWLSSEKTPILDFYQFWLTLDDAGVEYYLKIYTPLDKPTIDETMTRHTADPSARIAQRALAESVTATVHGPAKAQAVVKITTLLFGDAKITQLTPEDLSLLAEFIPALPSGTTLLDALVESKIASSKTEARNLISSGAISINGQKSTTDQPLTSPTLIKKGKNKFILIK